ncbi:MAG: hypothetical protein ACI4MS_06230 [Candidatus Coproplasma sp.]
MKYELLFENADPVIADGEYLDGVHSLNYTLDGNNFAMTVQKDMLSHKTLGEEGLFIEFKNNANVEGVLRLGAMTAPYPVFCSLLEVAIDDEGFVANVEFFPEGDTKRVMKVSARKKQS